MKYSFKENIQGSLIIIVKNIFSFFPLKIRYKIFENFGLAAYYLIKKRRIITVDNIRHAFPEKTEKEIIRIAKESYKTMGRMIVVSIYLKEVISNGNTVIENEALVQEICEKNEKTLIVITLHMGGFETGSRLSHLRKVYAVFRKQKNRKLNDLIVKWREEGKLHSIPLRNNDALKEALKNRSIIGLASDHYADDVEIEYFGRRTKAVSGPVILNLKYKVPLLLSYSIFEDNIVKIVNKKIIEIEKKENLKETVQYNMQKIFHEFEEIIKEYPEQYMWQHKRWR